MLLQKTEKARLELSPGVRSLSLRERSLLLLADGKPLADLQSMYSGIGAQIVDELLRQGYLELPPSALPSSASAPQEPATATASPDAAQATRSLAGARMYLFDICERLYARRDPLRAQQLRDALRTARDLESMLGVGASLFDELAEAAGADRAHSLRAQFQRLLPAASAAPAPHFDAAASAAPS